MLIRTGETDTRQRKERQRRRDPAKAGSGQNAQRIEYRPRVKVVSADGNKLEQCKNNASRPREFGEFTRGHKVYLFTNFLIYRRFYYGNFS